jgi:hypothetical protein
MHVRLTQIPTPALIVAAAAQVFWASSFVFPLAWVCTQVRKLQDFISRSVPPATFSIYEKHPNASLPQTDNRSSRVITPATLPRTPFCRWFASAYLRSLFSDSAMEECKHLVNTEYEFALFATQNGPGATTPQRGPRTAHVPHARHLKLSHLSRDAWAAHPFHRDEHGKAQSEPDAHKPSAHRRARGARRVQSAYGGGLQRNAIKRALDEALMRTPTRRSLAREVVGPIQPIQKK